MKISTAVIINSKIPEVKIEAREAAEGALMDVSTEITSDAIKGSPVLYGNNRRSIRQVVEGLLARIFSSSGYGGYLETGTVKMPARPYFKPALDRNINKFGRYLKERLSR